jgi:phage shock protein PspC (stress-responsive transcriptional regulator)
MNKTININLGGVFFHIDEVAFQKLKRYLDAIKRSLSDDPQGRDEILNDIEQRIGELLAERIKDARQVVNEGDIDEITKIMGKPEDYMVDEEMFDDAPGYRKTGTTKRLFRDPDDKFLGGVCAGLAHYFGMDTIWMRIIWLILFFGFGIGLLIYILLWILIPSADTTTEKLQMKGEPVNISNIEKKIREEFQDVTTRVKDGVNDVTDKVKSSKFKKNVESKAKSGMQELIDTLGKIIMAILTVLGKIIGALLVFIAAVTLISLIFGIFSWGSFEIIGFGDDWVSYPPFFYDSILPSWLILIFAFVAIGIPFVVLFMLGLRILSSNVRSFGTTTKLALLGIWIISLLGLGFAAVNFATQTAYDGVATETTDLNIVANDTVVVRMVGNEDLYDARDLRRRYSSDVVYQGDVKRTYSTRLNLDIRRADGETAYIKIRRESEGKSRKHANDEAQAIEYEFNLTDKNLLLDGYYLSDLKNMFREQLVDIKLYLPLDAVIYLDANTRTYLDDVDNVQNIYDRDMPKNYFKMTEEGLYCLDCDPTIFSAEYKNSEDYFRLNINRDGVEISVQDGDEDAEVTIDENGIEIK